MLFLLIALVLVLVGLVPWLRQYNAETARMEREAARMQTAQHSASEIASLEQMAKAARSDDPEAQFRIAQTFNQYGRWDDAERHARTALGLRPTDVEILLLLSDIYNHARRHAEAVATYRAALYANPNETRALVGLAYQYLSFGWVSEAIALLEPALRANPDTPQIPITLALAYMQREDNARSEQLLTEVRQKHPKEAALWSPLVQLYNNSRRHARALEVGQEALALSPDNLSILTEIGKAQYGLNQLDEALATFRKILALHPDNTTALYTIGLCYHRLKNPTEAIPPLEAVYKQSPDFSQVRVFLGKLYTQTNRKEEGKRLLAEARKSELASQKLFRTSLRVSQNGGSAEAHYQYALAHREAGSVPRALLEASRTLELAPEHAGAQKLLTELKGKPLTCTLGSFLLGMGRNAEAAHVLDGCARSVPNDADALVMTGLAELLAGNIAKAQKHVERAVRIQPENTASYLLLARIYGNTEGSHKMKEAIDAYLSRSQNPAPGYYLLARFHYRRADFANADQAIRLALKDDPTNPDYLAMKGHIYCELNRERGQEEGIRAYEQSLLHKPGNWEVESALGRAYQQRREWNQAILHLRNALQHAPDPGPLYYNLGQALLQSGQTAEGNQMLAQYTAHRNYKRESDRLKRRIAAQPRDRAARYALARLCLDNHQYAAAVATLEETERLLGADDALRQLLQRARSESD